MINFAKQGNPGSKFKNVAERMRKALFLPKNVKEELGVVEEEDADPNAEDPQTSWVEDDQEQLQESQNDDEDQD